MKRETNQERDNEETKDKTSKRRARDEQETSKRRARDEQETIKRLTRRPRDKAVITFAWLNQAKLAHVKAFLKP